MTSLGDIYTTLELGLTSSSDMDKPDTEFSVSLRPSHRNKT